MECLDRVQIDFPMNLDFDYANGNSAWKKCFIQMAKLSQLYYLLMNNAAAFCDFFMLHGGSAQSAPLMHFVRVS